MQDASVAVTHDSEWASVVLQDETAIPDGQQLYHRLRERYALRMNENGVYFDSPDNSLEGVAGDIPVTSALETGAKEERKWSVPSFLSSFGHVRYLRPIRSLESSVNPGMSEETATSDISLVPERVIRLLLLGQSESGKSTLLRQFQRLYDSEMFEQQRSAWRPVIQLNILSSIRTILAAVSPRIVPGRLSPAEVSDTITDTPALVVDSASGIQLNSFSHIENLTTALLPLLEVEDVLSHALGVSADKNLTVPSQVPAAIESPPTVEMNPARIHDSNTEVTISRPREPNTSTQFAGSNGLETTTQSVLHSLSGDMLRLWEDSDVQAMLDTKEIHLEESPGFFLNDLPRVTALNYVPSDDDVMKARQKTIEASDYTFKMKPNQYSDGQTWSITDVGGSKAQRQQWSTFFQNVSAIIFLAPMSCFNQSLTEDSNINRLEDSWTLWKEICSNILLAQVDLILFLNKYDIFDRKLKAGIQLSKFIPSYRDRSNDVKTASAYLRSKFSAIHKTHSPAPRHLHCFFTSVTDAPSSLNVIRSVQDTVARQNLASSDLI
ncbi:G-protein alpha subunit-domain-containing protein [Mycena epipterygia]|nr:G-protein alpha subunit-domain-containing protein [Mycena epipterygia]